MTQSELGVTSKNCELQVDRRKKEVMGRPVSIFSVTVHGFKSSGGSGLFLASFHPVWRSMSHQRAPIRRYKPRNRPSKGRILPKRSCARFESGRCCFFCSQPGTL